MSDCSEDLYSTSCFQVGKFGSVVAVAVPPAISVIVLLIAVQWWRLRRRRLRMEAAFLAALDGPEITQPKPNLHTVYVDGALRSFGNWRDILPLFASVTYSEESVKLDEPSLPRAVVHDRADLAIYHLKKKLIHLRTESHHQPAATELVTGVVVQMPSRERSTYKPGATVTDDQWDDGQLPELAFGYIEVPWQEPQP